MADLPDVDLGKVGTTRFGSFEVEVVDYTAEYFATLKVRYFFFQPQLLPCCPAVLIGHRGGKKKRVPVHRLFPPSFVPTSLLNPAPSPGPSLPAGGVRLPRAAQVHVALRLLLCL